MKTISIGNRIVGEGYPCFIIAEAGVNHNGRLSTALRLVDKAVEAGADAVKFQSFRADAVASRFATKAEYQRAAVSKGVSQLDMLRKLELDRGDHKAIMAYCRRKRIIFLSTPFDEESLDMLVDLGVCALKTGSGELTNLPFLQAIARKSLPVILSTGMATMDEVDLAVKTVSRQSPGLALLHCVSSYPACPADANLLSIVSLAKRFKVPCGFSDHIQSNIPAYAAVALGARIVEKHLTLNCRMAGPDHKASLDPAGFKQLVDGIRVVESALGSGVKKMAVCERDIAAAARRSIFSAKDLLPGSRIRQGDLVMLRPGTGLPALMLSRLYGKKPRRIIPAGTMLKAGMCK